VKELERKHLVETDRHIAECKEYIAKQRELIERAIQRGRSTEVADNATSAIGKTGQHLLAVSFSQFDPKLP
jgi:hypothetical protein